MPTDVIMPALGMVQETGRLIRWLVEPGTAVKKGDPLMEVETDKAVVEVEAPAGGILAQVTAAPGDEVPVAQVIAVILAPGEAAPAPSIVRDVLQPAPGAGPTGTPSPRSAGPAAAAPSPGAGPAQSPALQPSYAGVPAASPLAVRVAAEHGVDLRLVAPRGSRIEKADVLTYVEAQSGADVPALSRRVLASPKARRLAAEQGLPLTAVRGTGPQGAVQVADVLAALAQPATVPAAPSAAPAPVASMPSPAAAAPVPGAPPAPAAAEAVGTVWRIMAERMTQSWTTVPHFYLMREVNAQRLMDWRAGLLKRSAEKITYTDLLTKIVAAALAKHPRLNASWRDGAIVSGSGIHVGIAAAVESGLVVPVIHDADRLGIAETARLRGELTARAQAGRLRQEDLAGGTFTISNLGMYGVDAFNAIVNPPQAAILAVGRIADRVVAVNGRPRVRPTMILSLSCDHRVVDGARGAAFLDTVAGLIEEPLDLLD